MTDIAGFVASLPKVELHLRIQAAAFETPAAAAA
jgi:hypothetical protein